MQSRAGGTIAADGPLHHPVGYVGAESCTGCHQSETKAWRGSHHANAMAVPNLDALKDRFNGAAVRIGNSVYTPSVGDRGALVRVEEPGRSTVDHLVAYTFGVFPLQQYLVAFPGGRYQVLPIAWDERPADQGGQRWFNFLPQAAGGDDTSLHWTSYNHTWNSMCGDCHSTGFSKGYDRATDAYRTTWSDISVACESCHGPGAEHVRWAEGKQSRDTPHKGFDDAFKDGSADGHWGNFDSRGIRRWNGGERRGEIDRCASCHARRRSLQDDIKGAKPMLETNALALLDEGLYYPDGQIQDEVFELGSYLQSRMWHEQVVCTDCHEPHGGSLKASGNAVCGQCHDPQRFNGPDHHHHAPDTAAAQCTTCHMPSRTYMGVDVRHDHSFRLPAPARAEALGAPDACTTCHAERGANWAEAALNRWAGGRHRTGSNFAEALAAGRQRSAGAEKSLIGAAADTGNPPLARATALSLLARFPGERALRALTGGLADADPLVRLGAVRGAAPYRGQTLDALLFDRVRDPVRAVRSEAARLLASNPNATWSADQRQALESALDEWIGTEQAAAERPESQFNLGTLWAELGKSATAEEAFKDALVQDPGFTSAALNLADLYRSLDRNEEGEKVLRSAVAIAPDDADAHYALGLALVRSGRREEALTVLEKAATLKPDDARFAYVFGLGLAETGQRTRALAVLDHAHQRFPEDRDLLLALISLARQLGEPARALDYERSLNAIGRESQ